MQTSVDNGQVVEEVALKKFEGSFVPDEQEDDDEDVESDHEEDEEKHVLLIDIKFMKERQFGSRKSERKRTQTQLSSYMLNSQQIALSEDSGMEN